MPPTVMLDPLTRAAEFRPATFNDKDLTVDAVITTGAAVQRRDARGPYTEILNLSGVDVEGGALNGLPVLDSHRNGSGRDVIGRVVSARRDNIAIVATIRLSSASDVTPLIQRIREGTLSGISIGYRAGKVIESMGASGDRIRTVTPIIFETSIVPVPADPGSTIRSDVEMPPEVEEIETLELTPEQARTETRAAIRTIARQAGLGSDWADAQIDAYADVTTARAAAFEAMQNRTRQVGLIRTQVGHSNDDPAVILERRTSALFSRVNGTAPEDAARQYVHDGLADHARAILTMSGRSVTGMDRESILRAAMHTTSDFPNLLTGVGNRTLLPAYQAAQSPLKSLARQATLNDFRTATKLMLGEIGQLKKVTEAGEIQSTSRGEAAESYALDTYASLFALSRKAIINDDLGAFRDWGVAAGRAAAETEAALLWSLLSQSSGAGPIMGDGVRLFHASHGNLAASGSDPDDTSMSAARLAMRTQKGLDGVTPIQVSPKYILVGPTLETIVERVLGTIYAATTDDVNPFTGKLTMLVDPRITDNSWYIFADPAQMAVLEYAYLSSAQGPQIASREGWDVLGMEFRVHLDFGCGAIDHRGAYRNPGDE